MRQDHLPSEPARLPASIEATPTQALACDDLRRLPPGTRVYLTDLGTGTDTSLAAAAAHLRGLGLEPVPHVAVRRIASRAAIETRLKRLRDEAGVADVLVVGGGAARPAGPFAETMSLLETGLLDACGIVRIGVAGHPEGSPDIAPEEVDRALLKKHEFARRTGAEMRIVTQFGFDAPRVVGWLASLADAGIGLPVHIGLAGPARVTTLLRYAAMCGVGPSLGFLKKRSRSLATLATTYSPESLVEPIESWHGTAPASPVAAVHVFPFGGIANAVDWLEARGSLGHAAADPEILARTSTGTAP